MGTSVIVIVVLSVLLALALLRLAYLAGIHIEARAWCLSLDKLMVQTDRAPGYHQALFDLSHSVAVKKRK